MKIQKLSSLPAEDLEKYSFKHESGILSTDINGESVVMNLMTGQYSSFNPVGTVIWSALTEEKCFTKVLELVLDRFEVEREIATGELIEFLDMLLEKKMITITQAPE